MKKKSLLFLLIVIACFNTLDSASICTVIDQEGSYEFGGMTGDPTDTDDSLICIRSSNVELDLGDGIYSQVNGNNVAGFNGITIDSGFTNITIKNGTFNRFTGIGISTADNNSDITLENIEIINTAAGGILFNGTSMSPITDCKIKNCIVEKCNGVGGGVAYGLRLIECNNINLQDSSFNNNDAGTSNSGFGASIEFCSNVRFINCSAEQNGGNLLATGFSSSNSDWTLFENCKVINTVARNASGRAVGYLFDTSNFSSALSCQATHNSNLVGKGYGFEISDGSDNICLNCLSRNNVGSITAAGFILQGTETGSSIFRCISRSNDGGVAGNGYGILINGPGNCDIWYNQLVDNKGLIGVGLADTTTNSTNLYSGNVAFNNTTTGFDVPRDSGTFPSASSTVGDFSNVTDISQYININFTT